MKYRWKRKRRREAERQARHDERTFVDLVTGDAGARFEWVDVRRDDGRERSPVRGTDAAVTIERLRAGEPLPLLRARRLRIGRSRDQKGGEDPSSTRL